ncbi:MAG: hypothetical protein MJ252_29640 [archaeon]|nr:hypothetical protein [archaeon]
MQGETEQQVSPEKQPQNENYNNNIIGNNQQPIEQQAQAQTMQPQNQQIQPQIVVVAQGGSNPQAEQQAANMMMYDHANGSHVLLCGCCAFNTKVNLGFIDCMNIILLVFIITGGLGLGRLEVIYGDKYNPTGMSEYDIDCLNPFYKLGVIAFPFIIIVIDIAKCIAKGNCLSPVEYTGRLAKVIVLFVIDLLEWIFLVVMAAKFGNRNGKCKDFKKVMDAEFDSSDSGSSYDPYSDPYYYDPYYRRLKDYTKEQEDFVVAALELVDGYCFDSLGYYFLLVVYIVSIIQIFLVLLYMIPGIFRIVYVAKEKDGGPTYFEVPNANANQPAQVVQPVPQQPTSAPQNVIVPNQQYVMPNQGAGVAYPNQQGMVSGTQQIGQSQAIVYAQPQQV